MAPYDTPHLAMLLPKEHTRIETLSVAELDSEIADLDARVTTITNSMSTARATLLDGESTLLGLLENQMVPALRLRSVFALTGLREVLDSNLTFRLKLVYARSKARATSALS